MKFQSTLLAPLLGLLAIGSGSAATVVFSENFNSYTTGNLTGKGGWVTSYTGDSRVQVGPGAGINTTQTATRASTNTASSSVVESVSLGLGNYTSGTFQMDIMRAATGGGSVYSAGFDNASTSTGFSFGLSSSNFFFRQGVTGGTALSLYSAASTAFGITAGNWYRLTADISFTGSNSTITGVTIQNLTSNGTALTAYFNSTATQTTLALASDETTWNKVYVRTAESPLTLGYVDNLQFTAVPEPATWVLLAASLTTAMVLRRRRRV